MGLFYLKQVNKYYTSLNICSYNSIFNFVNTNRNYGKTWGFKKRCVRRAIKHSKKTIWIRRFKKEVKECIATFFKSVDLQKFCNISFYDKETNPKGNLKQNGNTFYIKRGKKWYDFLKVVALSDANAMRSADDVQVDTIIFDEYTTTVDKYKQFKGDEVTNFIDIFFSAKRNHKVKCFFLGNKESYSNPYFNYFKIPVLPYNFDGIKHFKNNSIAVEQRNNESVLNTEYDKLCFDLFNHTSYGDYIYNSKYKNDIKIKKTKPPPDSTIYVQIYFNKSTFSIWRKNDLFYIDTKINNKYFIYCDELNTNYSNSKQLLKRHKTYFKALLNAISDNNVFYINELCFEQFRPFLKWLGTF